MATTVQLNFASGGDAVSSLKAMAGSASQLNTEEDKYQKKLLDIINAMDERKRIQEDLIKLGRASAPLDAEDAYQKKLDQTIQALEEKKRLQADLASWGLAGPPPLPPQTLQQKAAEAIFKQKEAKALKDEIKRQGGGPEEKAVAGLGESFGSLKISAIAAAASLATFQYGLAKVAGMVAVKNDSSMTDAQKDRSFRESIPVIGGVVKALNDLEDAASGLTDALHANDVLFRVLNQRVSSDLGRMARVDSASAPAREAFERMKAHREFGVQMPDMPGNLLDDRQMAAFQRQAGVAKDLPAAQREQQAQAELAQAGTLRIMRMQLAAQEQRIAAGTKTTDLRSIMQKEDAKGPGQERNQSKIDDAARAAMAENDARKQLQGNILQEIQRTTGQKVAAAQAEAQAQDALLNKDRERLNVLKEQEQRLKGQATAFGGLDKGQQMFAEQSAKQIKERGFDSLAVEQKRALQAAGFGEYVERQNIRQAEADPRLKGIRDALGEKGNLAGVRKEQLQLEGQIALRVDWNKGQLQKELAAIQIDMVKLVREALKEIGQAEKDNAVIREMQGNNVRGGGR